MTNLSFADLRTCSQHFIRFPHLRWPIVVSVPFRVIWWANAQHGVSPFLGAAQSTNSQVRSDFHIWFSPGFQMQQRHTLLESFSLHRETNSSSALILLWLFLHLHLFCVLFDITSENSAELKWLMLNKHKRWFHSSRVKFLIVSLYASWFLVSMYLIWILGSRLIRSNNQSRATLWVLETCFIVGLLPLIIILITASLSSNTYNKASRLADWTFEGTESMSLKKIDFIMRFVFPIHRLPRSIWNTRNISKDRNN